MTRYKMTRRGRGPGKPTAESRPEGRAGEAFDLWQASGRTQEELAGLIGVAKGTVNRWCTGVSQPRQRDLDLLRERLD